MLNVSSLHLFILIIQKKIRMPRDEAYGFLF